MDLHKTVFLIVFLCWLVLGVAFVFRRRPPRAREVKRSRLWVAGLIAQAVSIGSLFAMPRPRFSAIAPLGPVPDAALAALTVLLALGAVVILVAAERTLGKQFAYQARLVEGHKLVTSGPYRLVRHPMYAALGALALATGLACSDWIVVIPFLGLYSIGTAIRVRSEERLLRGAFGAQFEDYARRVPAVIPGLR